MVDNKVVTMRLMRRSLVGRGKVALAERPAAGWSVGEALEVDVLARDSGVEGGVLGGPHPAHASAEVDLTLVDVGHQVAQALDVGQVGGVGGQPAVPVGHAGAGGDEHPRTPG